MSRFVLIPGAWHGAWCWTRVAAALHGNGHEVICPDLPQSGSLESWARLVVDVLRTGAPPVLVGHSRGGVVISRAAEIAPDAVTRLVYVAAYLLSAGGTVAEAARADTASLVAPNMVPARGGITCSLAARVVRDALYGCCSDADAADAASKLAPEPLKPLVTPLETTAQRFGRIPRAYVETLRDRAVSIGAQRAMRASLPCDPVLTLDTDHSPFLSRPDELSEWLGRL